jgi:hypothetical protein
VLPFLDGPLLRSSALNTGYGFVTALGGNPIEIVTASDIHVSYLSRNDEPRFVFRVSERVVVRVKDESAVSVLIQ